LLSASRPALAPFLTAFRRWLDETGYAEWRNLQIEYRWAEDDAARLPALRPTLVRANVRGSSFRKPAAGPQPAAAAMPGDRRNFRLSHQPPATSLSISTDRRQSDRRELLNRQSDAEAPRDASSSWCAAIAVLANPAYFEFESQRKKIEEAARVLGVEVRF